MGFLSPKPAAPPPVPPPPPAPPIKATSADSAESTKAKEKIRRRKGVSSTILTGPRGLLPEQMPTDQKTLLGS